MKERTKGFIGGIMVAAVIAGIGVPAMATVGTRQLSAVYNNIKITLDGKAITPTDASGNAVEAFTVDGTTYLPVRAVANAVGLGVEWDQATQTVKLSKGGSQAPSAPAGTYGRTNPAPVGTAQTINVDNYTAKYNASIVILESYRGDEAWTMIKNANQFNSMAPDGKEYVVVKIRASLNSVNDDKSVSFSDYSFTAFSSDNTEYSASFVSDPTPKFSGSLYAGGTLEGYAVYCVNKNDTAPKLVFGAKYDGTGGIWFSMTK